MNKDQFKGSWRQFKGELKKKWGEFTDNDLLEVEGDYDKFVGLMQKRYGDRKEEIERWTEDWWTGIRQRPGGRRNPEIKPDDTRAPDFYDIFC